MSSIYAATDGVTDRWRSTKARNYADRPFKNQEAQIGAMIEPHPNGCWLWTGRRDIGGYGMTPSSGPAHRYVYKVLVGPIPRGMVLHHECETPRCVNPAHLTPMTNGDHVAHHAALRRKAS